MQYSTPHGFRAQSPSISAVGLASIRLLEIDDLEPVAELFLHKFRHQRRASFQSAVYDAAGYMENLYFRGPDGAKNNRALVHVTERGDISGFLGVLATRYLLKGASLNAAIIGPLMANAAIDRGRAGPQLLRALNHEAFDLQLTDSANRISLAFARPMKYVLLPVQCLEWIYAFRPAAVLAEKLRRKWPTLPRPILSSCAHALDLAMMGGALPPPRHPSQRPEHSAIDAEEFAALVPKFLDAYTARPAWERTELMWLLKMAAERRDGGPLNLVRVTDSGGSAIGCYAFYGEPGHIAQTLLILAARRYWDKVLDSLIAVTRDMNCIGVAGQTQDHFLPQLYTYPGLVFRYAGGTLVRSTNPMIRQALCERDILVGGLAGDRWTRLSSDTFGTA